MNNRRAQIEPPPYSSHQIVAKAEELTKKYAFEVGLETAALGISFDALYEHVIYPDYNINLEESCDLGFDETGKRILGEYDPLSNTAFIDVSLDATTKDPRRAFTCGHEVGGHGVLQGEWIRRQIQQGRFKSRVISTSETIDLSTDDRFEQQANLFAAHLLAPSWLIWLIIKETYNLTRPIRYIGPSKYCLDVRGSCRSYEVRDFNELCRLIAYQIQFRFGWLSIEALSYRIERCPLVLNLSERSFRLRRTASQKGWSAAASFPAIATSSAVPTF